VQPCEQTIECDEPSLKREDLIEPARKTTLLRLVGRRRQALRAR
jgi:hypothetical protein